MSRVFANGPGDRGSIPVIPKIRKVVPYVTLLNNQHYKLRIKSKCVSIEGVEWSPFLHRGVVAIENGAFGLPSTAIVNNFMYICVCLMNR